MVELTISDKLYLPKSIMSKLKVHFLKFCFLLADSIRESRKLTKFIL